MKDNLVRQKSIEFAIHSIELYKELLEAKEFVLSKQFIRSATSIGANIEEALAGVSRRDFIHKMGIT
jgi:four helix bundle protein